MTDNHHPMLPTQEQLTEWESERFDEGENFDVMVIKAFQAGADQQLEQDAEWLDSHALFSPDLTISPPGDALREAMRPTKSLKEKALDPFLKNENFRRAIKDYGEKDFHTYDKKIRDDVQYLIKNLCDRFDYSEQGARDMCIYVIDNDLAKEFAQST